MPEVSNLDKRDFSTSRGHNTEVRFTFVRHSQKADGNVVNDDLSGISAANISPRGQTRAENFGKSVLAGRNLNKAYATDISRTSQTLESAARGAGFNEEEIKKLLRVEDKSIPGQAYFAMPEGARSQAFLRQYEEKMVGPREEYLASHFPGRKFSDLSPDEQEEVAEYANEFAVEWWLSFDDKRFDEETLSPREMAANVAYKINHLVNLPKFMPDNGSVDLLSVGHKTSTEAFLKFALERVANGDVVTGFENLVEIGGSLKILDSWELVAKTDSQGQLQVSLTIRRENGDTQVCSISREILRQLSLEYIKSHDLNIKKIDCLD